MKLYGIYNKKEEKWVYSMGNYRNPEFKYHEPTKRIPEPKKLWKSIANLEKAIAYHGKDEVKNEKYENFIVLDDEGNKVCSFYDCIKNVRARRIERLQKEKQSEINKEIKLLKELLDKHGIPKNWKPKNK